LLLIAGHETTVNLLGNGLLTLLRFPAILDRLRNQPDLIPAAAEEMLRLGRRFNRTRAARRHRRVMGRRFWQICQNRLRRRLPRRELSASQRLALPHLAIEVAWEWAGQAGRRTLLSRRARPRPAPARSRVARP
jgi:hypothetical protein